VTLCIGNLKFGEMEFGEMKRNMSNWSNFCMLPRRAVCQRQLGFPVHHGLCGSYKLLYKRWALSMGKGKFRPLTAPTFIDRSSWNSNLRNMSGRLPHICQISLRLD